MIKSVLRFALTLSFLLLFLNNSSFSFSFIKPLTHENKISLANIDYLRASVFVKLSPKEFIALTGKKLNLSQRIYFKLIQLRLKHELRRNPDLLITNYFDPVKAKFKFDFLWFVIGGFIGPLGVLLAYLSKPRKGGPAKKDVITSAWLGFAGFVLWFGFLFLF